MHNSLSPHVLDIASKILKQGGVIAYPTEGVYGFGCNPFNQSAVIRLLEIKHRQMQKGLILVAACWSQLKPYIAPIPAERLAVIEAGELIPTTWVFPAPKSVPEWIRGEHDSVAVRVSTHPIIQQLCNEFKKPIVSTSANYQGEAAATRYEDVCNQFKEQLDMIIPGEVGTLNKPSTICDALTGEVLRT